MSPNMLKFLLLVWFVAVVCAQQPSPYFNKYLPKARKAVVSITGNGSNSVSGAIHFEESSQGIHITGTVNGLSQGLHGFHVHAIGDITGGCATTGPHFNPYNKTHGAPNATERHVGDLGNIEANASGIAVVDFYDSIISLHGENNIIGRGVVVHQDPDDLGLGDAEDSKTTGHAGARVGCGVIGTLSQTNSGASTSVSSIIFTILSSLVLSTFRRTC